VSEFFNEAGKLAAEFGWPAKTTERGPEKMLVALTKTDPSFERILWVYDTERTTMRCALVGNDKVPEQKEPAILELCARVNEGLPFGCLEYSFSQRVLVVRDSADLEWGPLDTIVGSTTSRVLNLGKKYSGAIRATLNGDKPADAVENVEKG
jgi:hypothetical protein